MPTQPTYKQAMKMWEVESGPGWECPDNRPGQPHPTSPDQCRRCSLRMDRLSRQQRPRTAMHYGPLVSVSMLALWPL